MKRTSAGCTEDCGEAADFRRVNSSFCALDLSISSGGNFLCENSSGQKRDEVSIIVSGTDAEMFPLSLRLCSVGECLCIALFVSVGQIMS